MQNEINDLKKRVKRLEQTEVLAPLVMLSFLAVILILMFPPSCGGKKSGTMPIIDAAVHFRSSPSPPSLRQVEAPSPSPPVSPAKKKWWEEVK